MSSTLIIIEPTLPVERRELLIIPADGDRLESVQTLYHPQEKSIDGVCCTFQEYQETLRQLQAEGYQITQKSCTPIVRGMNSWNITIIGIKKLKDQTDGQFEFQVKR